MTTPPLRVLVADDEPLARRRLAALLREHADVELVGECANGLEVLEQVQALAPDLLLLDVQMPGLTGLEAATRLAERTPAHVVFVTAYEQHALEAFQARALDYLLKPVRAERFALTLARTRERLRERRALQLNARLLEVLTGGEAPAPAQTQATPPAGRLSFRVEGRVVLVPEEDVRWVEAEGDSLRVHTADSAFTTRMTLSALEQQVNPAAFARIHRSTLVRLGCVRELLPLPNGTGELTLTDGTRLALSRSYRERLAARLGAPRR